MSEWQIFHLQPNHWGRATVVEHIPTASFGVSVCSSRDQFSKKRGVEIAKLRALEVSRRDGGMLVGIPPKSLFRTSVLTKMVCREAYPEWQHAEAVALVTPELWLEIPYNELPYILDSEDIMKREFKGYDWYELRDIWGIRRHRNEEKALAAIREKIEDEMAKVGQGERGTYVTDDLRRFVAVLAQQDEQTDQMLWIGLYLIKCDWTFLKYCSILLESMWT